MGLYCVSRKITSKGLRILCYHNFSKGDAIQWKSKLFIHPDTFKLRLNYLEKKGFKVLPLDKAVRSLHSNRLPRLPVVITIDDGWQRTLQYADQILKEKRYPYTVYASTYYSKKQSPVVNLVIQYMFWKSNKRLDKKSLEKLGVEFDRVNTDEEQISVVQKYVDYILDYDSRYKFLSQIGEILGVDFSVINDSMRFHLLTAEEIERMSLSGVDFQLHTHRHRWPLDKKNAFKEIVDNRNFLYPLTKNSLVHFCYPSGFWMPEQFEFLKEMEIVSAVTCEAGFNFKQTSLFRLYRFLDGENITQLEFEAELSGILELFRRFRRLIIKILADHKYIVD